MTGTAKDMTAFQNNVKNGDEAVLQALSINTSNLSRSHETHQDKISTENNSYENKSIHDTSSMINNTTTINTGTNYQGVVQAAMENGSNLEMMVGRLADMKGKVSDEEYKAEVRKFSGAYAQEMGQFLEKSEQESWGTQGQAGVSFDIKGNYNSNNSWYGKAAEGATGLSVSASGGFSVGANLSMNNATQEAQNLIAKEMYDTIMQSGNTSDMMNNVSNLANTHAHTNLSDLENLGNKLNDMTEQAKQVGGNIKEVGGNMVNNAKNLLK